ncbi:MAG: lytic transglycosylase domain-containing protein [Deltaproteobacteria bacterium]|nr:lytic transglycosylase domain-containing protein [Deltaproteobacteria bacterium]
MKSFSSQICLAVALALAASLSMAVPAQGEIYRYVDKNGVWHFTNIKTDSRYRIFVPRSRKALGKYLDDYRGIIHQASTQFGIEPHFIQAIIRAESGFDHQAVSSKGAQGLMQLMPGTAGDMEVSDPFDPEDNIFGGVRYLSLLLKRFNDDKILTLAAYNAGPNCVESHKGVPPFPETREFIKRVMRYYETYQAKTR